MRLDTLFQQQASAFKTRMAQLEEKRQNLTRQHKIERQKLRDAQHLHWQHKQQEWRNNLNKGFRGLFERITGKHRKIEERNEQDAWQVKLDQQQQRDTLIFNQLEIRRSLQSRITRLQVLKFYRLDELEHDKSQYQAMREQRIEQLERHRPGTNPQPPAASPARPGLVALKDAL